MIVVTGRAHIPDANRPRFEEIATEMCRRSREDPAYPRYPRLPVLACPGYEPAGPGRSG